MSPGLNVNDPTVVAAFRAAKHAAPPLPARRAGQDDALAGGVATGR